MIFWSLWHFKNLYSSECTLSQEEYQQFIQNLEIPRLSNEDRDSLEGPLTYEVCKKVLDSFQNNKSPGVDGFTVEFYKFFFDLLGNDLFFKWGVWKTRTYHLATKRHNYFTTKRRWCEARTDAPCRRFYSSSVLKFYRSKFAVTRQSKESICLEMNSNSHNL